MEKCLWCIVKLQKKTKKPKQFAEPYIWHQSIFVKLKKYLPSDLCTEKTLKAVSTKRFTGYLWVFFFCFCSDYFYHKNKSKNWKTIPSNQENGSVSLESHGDF